MGGNFEFRRPLIRNQTSRSGAFPTHHFPDEIVRSHYPEVAGRLDHSLILAITFRQCRHDASAIERYGSLSDLTPPIDAQPANEVEWKRPGCARGKGYESFTRGPLAPVAWNPTSDSYFRRCCRNKRLQQGAEGSRLLEASRDASVTPKPRCTQERFSGTRLGFSYVPTRLG